MDILILNSPDHLLLTRSSSQFPLLSLTLVRLCFPELQQFHGVRRFELERSCCFSALLLDEERGRLFVGAKNFLLSLSLDNIAKQEHKIYWPAPVDWREECNWAGKDITTDCVNYVKIVHHYNRTHLYACGTGAFHPTCAFVEVGNRMEVRKHNEKPTGFKVFLTLKNPNCLIPADPLILAIHGNNCDELYAGVATDLMGRDFTIFRSLGRRPSIRTEQHDSRWLNEPKFVGSFWVPESENPDDDKIFFFFRETAVEAQGLGKSTYSRIGQLCRNDMGGQRSLVNKWTTFLKTRLICSVPGADGSDTYFDELRDVFLLQTRDRKNPLVYSVFSTSSSVFKGSAVCLYSMNDIRRAFLGPFAHKEGPNYQWVPFQGKVPYPRPGMCPSKTFGSFESTKGFPDDVIQFARHHPLMYNPVYPMNRRPIFVRTNVDYSFTQLAVDRVNAADGQYDVMFIGTDKGTVLKVINVPKESWNNMEELLLEELEVFKQQLYVGSHTGIAQVPLHRCSVYGKACAECCLARDPYCAWDGTSCTRYLPNTKRRFRRQDVRNGDPNTLCSGDHHKHRVAERKLFGVEGSSTFLECIPKSLQARVTWTFQKHPQSPREEVRLDDRLLQTDRGLLVRRVLKRDVGVYQCHAMEHGFTQTLLGITLEVVPSTSPSEPPVRPDPRSGGGPPSTNQKLWYRDFMQLVDHPNLSAVDQICEQVWARKNAGADPAEKSFPTAPKEAPPLGPVGRPANKKWKHLQEIRKGRNRRTHDGKPSPRAPRSAGE
uniref:Sema domain, immunoglobulin domain (Ig), short basic domain, secreted, (semaphorin) 3B n=1 Tax=Sphaeramia orbicularis TaxID=375764 RepID=A0A673BD16_9TELE